MRLRQINKLLVSLFLLSAVTFTVSAVELDSLKRDPKYVETIVARSKKIVDNLKIKDETVKTNVLNIVCNKYFSLNDIYTKRDTAINQAKRSGLSKELINAAVTTAKNETESALYRSHFAFAADLSLFIKDKQIEAIKDGMTFGVVKVTYDSTLDMIPSLTKEEKAQILAWLKEAREFAVDAESANKKHEAFGKYKGRINNYLSKRGYDLVKERQEWYKRIEARKKKEKK